MLYRYVSKKRVCEITNGQDRRILAATLQEELGSFTAQYGIEITSLEISDVKIIKEGDNMAISALSAVAKSDAGQQLWKAISPLVEEFTREMTAASCEVTSDSSKLESADASTTDPILIDHTSTFDEDRITSLINLAIDENLTRIVGKVFQVNCSEIEPFYIDLKHSPGICSKGNIRNADVVFYTSKAILIKIIKKELSPVQAYMKGSLKIEGSIQDAILLKYLADRVAHLF